MHTIHLLMISWSFTTTVATAFATAEDRPNTILFTADEQGWGETSYNGRPHPKTPSSMKRHAPGCGSVCFMPHRR